MYKLPGSIFCFVLLMLFACKSTKEPGKNTSAVEEKPEEVKEVSMENKALDFSAGPQTIVYRTREDYRKNVAVTLNEDKTEVVSYPHPNDVYYKGLLAYPYPLKNGYLLDNRGINKNTAFISMNYEQYSKLTEPPSLTELYEMIIDKNPIIEMCNCGNRNQFRNDVAELNDLIADSALSQCQKIW